MQNKLIKIAKDTNLFLKKFIRNSKKDQQDDLGYFQVEKKLDQKF